MHYVRFSMKYNSKASVSYFVRYNGEVEVDDWQYSLCFIWSA